MAKKLYLHHQPGFRQYLEDAYINRRLTMKQIAEESGCSAATILGNLRRFEIPIRPTSEYNTGRTLPQWHIDIIKRTHAGKCVSEDTRRKISETRKAKNLKSPNWNGGKRTGRSDGYVQVYMPHHPYCSKEGYVMEHRLVMERAIGRYLTEDEVVHHINGKRSDNRLDNLKLMTCHEHMSYHMKERWRKKREQNLLSGPAH